MDIGQNISHMNKGYFTRLAGFAAMGLAAVVTIGIASFAGKTVDLKAGIQSNISCGDILFGTGKQASSSIPATFDSRYFTSSNTVVGISSTSLLGSVYATQYTGTADNYSSNTGIKLGKGGDTGSITFYFSSSIQINKIIVYAMCNSSAGGASAPFTVTTDAHGSNEAVTCSTLYSKTGGDPFEFTQFSSDTLASSSFTIANTGSLSSNTLNLCKIVFAVSTSGSTSSSVSSSKSSSSSSSSSSIAPTLSSISASGMSKTTYTAGETLDTTGLVVTALYSNGYSTSITGYTTNPTNGAILATTNTAMTISYTERGVTKTTNVALTVNPVVVGHQLMVRFKEILSSMYCDSIYIKYGDWDCLIDGGNTADKDTVASALQTYCTDHKLDMYIATHSHNDHAGIFTSATTSNNVFVSGGVTSFGYVIDCGSYRNVAFWQAYCNVVRNDYMVNHGATYIPVHAFFNNDAGYTSFYGKNLFTIDQNFSLRFLNTNCYLLPGETSDEDPNPTSVACLISAWNERYIFSGDGTGATQNGIMANYSTDGKPSLWNDSNDVYLKANHHGSDTENSNNQTWIDWVKPDHVLISAAIVSSNLTSSGVTTEQHPDHDTIQRFESSTYDIHWNGINGDMAYTTSSSGSSVVFSGTAKSIPYYYGGVAVTGEETTTFPMSKWCTYDPYIACARTSAVGHDAMKRTPESLGGFFNSSFDYEALKSELSKKPLVNEHGELYDELADTYC